MNIKKEKCSYLVINTLFILLTLLVSNVISLSTFNILDYEIIGSVFTFPFVFYFANKILKIVDKKTFFEIIIGIVFIQLIVFYIMNKEILLGNIASVVAFFISQMVYMFLVKKLKKKDLLNFEKTFFIYTLVIIIDAVLFSVISGTTIGISLLYAIIIKLFIGIILTIIDIKNV